MKSLANGLNSRMEETEERISELEDRTTEIPNLNNIEEVDLKKKCEQSLRGLWDQDKYLIMSSESQKDRRKRVGLKKYSKK